jgi:histidinol-phosphatase (PHP family)
LLIPYTPKDWADFAKLFGGIKGAIELYYKQIDKLIESGLFDCVGHFDVIKNNYSGDWKKIESQSWYKDMVLSILDKIKKARMCIEINTSGWTWHIGEQNPSEWILRGALKRGIPITIGSDFHRDKYGPNQKVDSELSEAIALAKKVGYKSILIFKKRKPIEVKL